MSEPTVTTVDYVRASLAGDALKAKEIFNQLMAPKVVDAIDIAKHEVAQNYFGEKPEVEQIAQQSDAEASAERADGQDTESQEEETTDENA